MCIRDSYCHAEKIAVGQLVVNTQPLIVAQTMLLRILYDRESVFCTDQIGELSDSPIAPDEVAELVCAVKCLSLIHIC